MTPLRVRSALAALLALSAAVGLYVWAQSPSERWLLLCGSDAEAYAESMLAGQASKWPPADCLVDVSVTANPKDNTAIFSPHDGHEVVVIYAPGRSSEQINYEMLVAHRVRENWYAVN